MDHEEEDNEGSDADEVEAERENNGGRGGSTGVVVAGVLLPLILLAAATIAVVVFLVWRSPNPVFYHMCMVHCNIGESQRAWATAVLSQPDFHLLSPTTLLQLPAQLTKYTTSSLRRQCGRTQVNVNQK